MYGFIKIYMIMTKKGFYITLVVDEENTDDDEIGCF